MLLQPNAPGRMGRERAADPEMRRARTGDHRALGSAEGLGGYQGTAEENKTLAASIRGFVEAMPTLDTERHRIKGDLTQKFTKQAEKIHGPAVQATAPAPSTGPKNGAEQAAPTRGDKDVER